MSNDLFLHRHTKDYRRANPYPLLEVPNAEATQQWLAAVSRQREAYPNQPYLSPLIPTARESSLSLYSISTLVSVGGYSYSGVKMLDYPLYRGRSPITCTGLWDDHTTIGDQLAVGDMDDDYLKVAVVPRTGLHWEFVKGATEPMEGREYLYLPVGTSYSKAVMELVPSLPYWQDSTNNRSSSGTLIPDRQYLLNSNHADYGEWYNVGPIGMGTSPFLPGLQSTGVTVVLGDGELLYEYQDREGWYSIPGMLYMSSLRPSLHQYPLGRPKPGDLVMDECLPRGLYPSKGTPPWVGTSTGYKTTPSYHPTRTYYLYEDIDGGTYLHDAVPSPNTWPLIEDLLGVGGINISLSCVMDELYIRDRGCGVAVILPDLPAPRYTDGDVWGDCTWVGDSYYLSWDPCDGFWGDRVWVDNYLELSPCHRAPVQCKPSCWWDDSYEVNEEYLLCGVEDS